MRASEQDNGPDEDGWCSVDNVTNMNDANSQFIVYTASRMHKSSVIQMWPKIECPSAILNLHFWSNCFRLVHPTSTWIISSKLLWYRLMLFQDDARPFCHIKFSTFYIFKIRPCFWTAFAFYARQHICYSAYMLSPVRPSVCQMGGS